MKKKTLKKELAECREFLAAAGRRENVVCLERARLLEKCKEFQMKIRHLEERIRFHGN